MKTEYLWQFIFILVGALATGYAGYWFGNQPDLSSVVEYKEDVNNNLHQLIGDTEKLEITYKGSSLDALSNISYRIANTSKKNLDKVKIYFEMEKNSLPIFHNVIPPSNYPKEAITLISNKNGVFIFELEYLNRTESIWDGIAFSFYFGGGEPSKIKVKTGTKGVSIQEYRAGNVSVSKIILKVLGRAWWVFLIYVLIIFVVIKLRKVERKTKENMFRETIANEIVGVESKDSDEVVNNIIVASKRTPSFIRLIKIIFRKIS